MRRIAALLISLCCLAFSGCETASNAIRDSVFGGLAERYDTSHHPDDRRRAYDDYIREHVDR